MHEEIPALSLPGVVARPIDSFDVVRLDTPADEVELTFHGPEGPMILTGNTNAVYRLVVSLELALRELVVD